MFIFSSGLAKIDIRSTAARADAQLLLLVKLVIFALHLHPLGIRIKIITFSVSRYTYAPLNSERIPIGL